MSSESNFTPTPLNPEPQASHDAAPNVPPMKPLTGEHEAVQDATVLVDLKAQQRAQRQAAKLRQQGHATQGVCAQYHAVAAGRDAIPVLSESARERIFATSVIKGPGLTALKKTARTPTVQTITNDDGSTVILKFKPLAQETNLAAARYLEVLKLSKREVIANELRDALFAPLGLDKGFYQSQREHLNQFNPKHLMALVQHRDEAFVQDLLRENEHAWDTPPAACLNFLTCELPERPKAEHAKLAYNALQEIRPLFSEVIRLVIDDLSLTITNFNAKDSKPYLLKLQHSLSQSAKGFLDDVMDLGQGLPEDFAPLAMLDPEGFKAANCDIHQYLKATLLTPKGKHPTKARKSTKKAATTATASTVTRKSRTTKASVQPQQYDLLQLAEFDPAPGATPETGVTASAAPGSEPQRASSPEAPAPVAADTAPQNAAPAASSAEVAPEASTSLDPQAQVAPLAEPAAFAPDSVQSETESQNAVAGTADWALDPAFAPFEDDANDEPDDEEDDDDDEPDDAAATDAPAPAPQLLDKCQKRHLERKLNKRYLKSVRKQRKAQRRARK